MGTSSSSSSTQLDNTSEGDDEHTGPNKVTQHDTAEEEELQNNGQISSLCQKLNYLDVELNGQCEKVPRDVKNKCVKLKEDTSDTNRTPLESPQEDVFQESTEELNNDDAVVKEKNEVNSEVNDTEFGFKKIFNFGEFKLTLMKDNSDRTDAEELNKKVPITINSKEASPCNTNSQMVQDMKNDPIGGDAKKEVNVEEVLISENCEKITYVKGLMEGVSQNTHPEVAMSPVKRFFTQGIWSNLRKSKKDEEVTLKESNEDERKRFDKETNGAQGGSLQEDSTCKCLNISHITHEEGKDLQITEKDDSKPLPEKELFYYLEQDTVQTTPFKRLLRKISTRRHKETKPVETEPKGLGENDNEILQLRTDAIQFQATNEKTNVTEQRHSDEELNTSHEEKKRSDSIISWEALKCGGSFKKRSRKTSDSEEEKQDKEETQRTITESPLESSTEGDNHLTSSNEHTGSSAEDEGSTWKTLKKLVTPKRKSRLEESGSTEDQLSDTEIIMDESSCSLKKLILGHKKLKADVLKDILSSEGLSKDTETDNKEDETPVIVPLSEYEIVESESLHVMATKTLKIPKAIENEIHFMTEEDKPSQTKLFMKPLYSSGPSIVPIFSDNNDDLTEFISKYQQLSDIPEEGIIEESIATPASFTEWMTLDDTLAEELVDMTADAVTARELASEDFTGDETSEMVSAVSQLTESPKTSGNVTPVSHAHYVSEADLILQETDEAICVSPSALSFAINKVSEALPVSISPCITDPVTRTETKVFVIHDKNEATSFGTGLDSTEIGVEKVLPMSLLEGLLEICEAVPVNLVFEQNSKTPEMTTDKVFEAESNELEKKCYKDLKQNTTVKKSEQTIQMHEYIQDEVTCATEMKDVQGKTQLLREQVVAEDMNRSDNQGCEGCGSAAIAQDVGASTHDSSLNKALEITEDNAQIAIDKHIKLIANNGVAPLPRNTLNVTSKMTKEVKLTLNENVEFVANNNVVLVSENTCNQITDYQIALADYVELMPQDVIASVPAILNETSKMIKNAVKELQAVDFGWVEHNSVAAVTEITLNEAPRMKDNIVQFFSAEQTESLGDNDIASVSDGTFDRTEPEELQGNNVIITVPVHPDSTSDITEDVQVKLPQHNELLAQIAAELEDREIAVDVVQVPRVEYTVSVKHNDKKAVQTVDVPSTLIETTHSVVVPVADSIVDEFVQVSQTDVCCDLVSGPGSILNEASAIKDVVQIHQVEFTGGAMQTEVEGMLDCSSSEITANGQITQFKAVNIIELNILSLQPHSTENLKTEEEINSVVVEHLVTTGSNSSACPILDYVKVKAVEIENKVEMEANHPLHFVDSIEIQDTEVNELKIAKANAEAVPEISKYKTIQQEATNHEEEPAFSDGPQLAESTDVATQSAKFIKTESAETEDVKGPNVDDESIILSTRLENTLEHTLEAKSEIVTEPLDLLQTLETEPQNDTKQLPVNSQVKKSKCNEAMVLAETFVEKGTNVEVGAKVTESSLDIPVAGNKTSQASVTELQETSASKTDTVMEICMKESDHVISVNEDIELESLIFTTAINELQINTVVQEPLDKQKAVAPATPVISEVHPINETKPNIPYADIINASNRNNDTPTVASFTQLLKPTLAQVMRTSVMVLADEMPLEVQQQVVVPSLQTLAVNLAVHEAEIICAKPEIKKEPNKENINISQSYLMEQQVNFTAATEDIIQIDESTADYKGDTKDSQSTCAAKQHFISTVNTAE